METRTKRSRPPVVLIVDDQEWSTRSLESILAPSGFAVMRAYTGQKGLERAQVYVPDAVFVDINLPDGDGLDVCQALRDNPEIGPGTPIFVTSPERPSRAQRLDAFRAGAWDVLGYPLNAEELVLRLDAYVRAKFQADSFKEEGLVDPGTGLYNLKGLERRAEELASWAYREGKPLACVVIAPVEGEGDDTASITAVVRSIASAVRGVGRISDVIGRLGRTEIAIIAPSTDDTGAIGLAERLQRAINEAGPVPGAFELRAGYDAVGNPRDTPTEARDLLMRATIALRKSKSKGNGWIQRFESHTELPN